MVDDGLVQEILHSGLCLICRVEFIASVYKDPIPNRGMPTLSAILDQPRISLDLCVAPCYKMTLCIDLMGS